MLTTLPPELVRKIVRSTVPDSPLYRARYRERQQTLRALCLVSHYICSISQPVLAEVVWTHKYANRTLELAYESFMTVSGACAPVRSLYLAADPFGPYDEDNARLGRLLGVCHNLRRVEIACGFVRAPNLSLLADLPSLTWLALGEEAFSSRTPQGILPVVLPRVDTFLLACDPSESLDRLLDRQYLPAVRRLTLTCLVDHARIARVVRSRFLTLLEHLESLVTDNAYLVVSIAESLSTPLPRTLLRCDIDDLTNNPEVFARVHHLRLNHGFGEIGAAQNLAQLARLFKSQPSSTLSIKTVDLPQHCRIGPDTGLSSWLTSEQEKRHAMPELDRVCRSRGIEIFYGELDVEFGERKSAAWAVTRS